MGRRRVKTEHLQQHQRHDCKEKVIKGRSSTSKMVNDGKECVTPPASVPEVEDDVESFDNIAADLPDEEEANDNFEDERHDNQEVEALINSMTVDEID